MDVSKEIEKKNLGLQKPKIRKTPHAYVIMLILIFVATILTWVIPSGSFDRVDDLATGKTIVIADSFRYVEQVHINIFQALQAIPKGIKGAASIIAFIFIISGAVQVVKGTGALDAAIKNLVNKLKGRDTPLLVAVIVIFSLLGAIFGFAEETIPFIALGVSMATALGYDRVVGFHIIRTAAWVGFAGAFLNPFTIGVAQTIAELPLFSGLFYRLICYVVFMTIGFWFILSYAKKVKKDPKNSIIYGYEGEKDFKLDDKFDKFTTRHKLVLLVFLANIIFLIVGVLKFGWYINELSALFLGFGIICGIAGGFSPNEIAKEFTKGMSGVTFGAIIVGFARAIVVILEEGVVLDTIIYGLSRPILDVNPSIAGIGMFFVQWVMNFFISSGSGQAAATMPIMVPLSDIVGVTRQTAVLAYHFGDGITNMCWPSMIFYLAMADIPYDKWFPHIMKLVLSLTIAGIVLVGIAGVIGYGPF